MAKVRIIGMALMVVFVAATLAWLWLAPATPSTASPPPARSGPHHRPDQTPRAAGFDDPDDPSGEPPGRLCRALACSPAQRETIDPLTAAYDLRAAELRKDIKAQRAAFEPLWEGKSVDAAAVNAVAEDLGATRRALDDAALQVLLAAHPVLTPDQRQQLARMIARRGFVGTLEGPRKGRRGSAAE